MVILKYWCAIYLIIKNINLIYCHQVKSLQIYPNFLHLRSQILCKVRFQDEQSIKDLISQLVDQNKLKPKLLEAKLIAEWPKIIGEPIAKYTEKIQIYKGKLTLTISSPALRNELAFQRKALAELINKELNCDFIEDVVIR